MAEVPQCYAGKSRAYRQSIAAVYRRSMFVFINPRNGKRRVSVLQRSDIRLNPFRYFNPLGFDAVVKHLVPHDA